MEDIGRKMAQRPADPETGTPAFFVVRCRAPRKPSRYKGDKCGGFVARFPYPVDFVGLVDHSDDASPSSYVAHCRSCKRLHEFEVRGS